MLYNDNGKRPLIAVDRVENGWVVTVHHPNRETETSEETKQKAKEAYEQAKVDSHEIEKKRIAKSMYTQLAGMAFIGEVAGKAQSRAIDEELEAWKVSAEDKKKTPDEIMHKIEEMAEKIASKTVESQPSIGPLLGGDGKIVGLPTFRNTEQHVFTEREAMIAFVNEMLLPIIE